MGTHAGASIIHADLWLKAVVDGYEVSAKAPFTERNVEAPGGILASLPLPLRTALLSSRARGAAAAARGTPPSLLCDRVWFEVGPVPVRREEGGGGVTTYTFGSPGLIVRYQSFRAAIEGEPPHPDPLVAGRTEVTDTPGVWDSTQECVADLNSHMEALCAAVPLLGRLRELARLMAAASALQQYASKCVTSTSADAATRLTVARIRARHPALVLKDALPLARLRGELPSMCAWV